MIDLLSLTLAPSLALWLSSLLLTGNYIVFEALHRFITEAAHSNRLRLFGKTCDLCHTAIYYFLSHFLVNSRCRLFSEST
jgi:hypothetical protein